MKRPYEIPVVFRIISNDEEFQQAIDQVVAWIENSNEFEDPGTVTKIDRNLLGRRRLAYEIDGQRDGYYILFYADIDPRHLPEMELNLKLYEPVLRYLVVRDEPVEAAPVAPEVTE
jgi:small subunit ribosomal protein S6